MERQGSRLRENLAEGATAIQGGIAKAVGKTDQAAAMVGEKLESAAESLRGAIPQEGRFGAAAEAITQGLESSGNYLQAQGLTGIIDDLESLIRRYPVQALLVGVGCGYILSRLRAR